jgi:hypothetical protein
VGFTKKISRKEESQKTEALAGSFWGAVSKACPFKMIYPDEGYWLFAQVL